MRKHLRRTATAVLAMLLLSNGACTNSDDPAAATAAPGPAEPQPFSIFLGDRLGIVDYAQLKLLNQCLADSGYPQNLRAMASGPKNPFPQLIVDDRSFGPASEQEARERGFGWDEPPAPPSVVSFDPNYDKAQERCAEQAWTKLPSGAKKVYYSYFDLGNALGVPMMTMVNERMGEKRWTDLLTCLDGKGYPTTDREAFLRLPDPAHFGVKLGTAALKAEENWKPKAVPGTVEVGPAVPARSYRPSKQESDLAVAWYQCRRDTRVAREQMDTVLEVQQELVTKNEAALTELNPRVEEIAKQATALIGRA